MKKMISLVAVVMMLVSMFSTIGFAAEIDEASKTMTLSTSLEATKAKFGDEFEANIILDSSIDVKALGVKIAVDPDDIELGLSAAAKEIASDEAFAGDLASGVPLDEICTGVIGRKSYVSDSYGDTYATYGAKNLGDAAIDYEVLDGNLLIGFGYGITTAKTKYNKVDNMYVGGAVLKIKTTEAKQTTIKLVSADTTDGTNKKHLSIVNEIVLDLNGYGEVVEPTAKSIGLMTDDSQILRLSNIDVNNVDGTSYKVDTALGFVSCVNKDANATGLYTEINLEGWTGEALKIPANHTTTVGDQIYFVAAVTSIREANLKTPFTAKAYATVDGQLVEDSNTVSAAYDVQ